MKIKTLVIMLMSLLGATAVAQSPALEVKKIQKNTTEYINAESTAPSEDEARSNAMRQLIDMAKNYVETNNHGAQISDNAIKITVKEIVIPRGDFTRVFVYSSRKDLIGASKGAKPSTTLTEKEDEPINSTNDENGSNESSSDNSQEVNQQRTTIDNTNNENMQFEESETDSSDGFVEEVPTEIAVEIDKASYIPAALQEVITALHNSNSLMETSKILYRYKNRNVISNYGSPRESHNSVASYWVVEDNDKITVLGPEIRGFRKNFRTGQPDALHNYTKGLWFRKR